MRARTQFLLGICAVPVIFLLGAATSSPAWEMNSPLGEAMPLVLLIAGACCLTAAFRGEATGMHRIKLVLGAVAAFAAAIVASVFMCMVMWGIGIG